MTLPHKATSIVLPRRVLLCYALKNRLGSAQSAFCLDLSQFNDPVFQNTRAMSSTQGHSQSPPPSTIPSNGYLSSPRNYGIMKKDGSRHEHGAGDARRGGYDVSDRHDKEINPHQYQNRFGVLEPCEGGSDVRLPGIRTLDEPPHEGNRLTTSGRVLGNQNTHRTEDRSKSLRIYAEALVNRPIQQFDSIPRSDSSRRASSDPRTHGQPNF